MNQTKETTHFSLVVFTMYVLWIGFIFGSCFINKNYAFLSSHPLLENNCTEFTCRNNRCIPEIKRCDNRNDCLDNSDEEECGTINKK